MIETPRIVDMPERFVAAVHIETPRALIQQVMGSSIAEAMAAAKSQGVGPIGPWFAHHHRVDADVFDLDVCIPVSQPIAGVGRVEPLTKPALNVLQTIYRGPYEGLGGAWSEFIEWTKANGYETEPDIYERYVVGPESGKPSAEWQTELSQPIKHQPA